MAPADHRGDAERARGERHLGLVVELELALREPAPKIGLEQRAALDPALELIAAETAEIAALGLGPIHGAVGLAHQLRPGLAVARIERDAEAGGDRDLLVVDRRRRRHRVEQLAGDQSGVLGLGQVLDQDRELVAAEARHGVGLAQAAAETLGHDRQQAIAGQMPEAIVDRLEAVEVEDHDRDQALVAPGPGERALQTILEQRAVGEPGQLVVLRQVAEPFRLALAGESVADGPLETDRIEPVLVEEIGHAEHHRLQVELERGGARQHDDRGPEAPLLRRPRELQAMAVGQAVVDQADVERARAQPPESGLEIGRPLDRELEMGRRLEPGPRGPEVGLVGLDQQDPDRPPPEQPRAARPRPTSRWPTRARPQALVHLPTTARSWAPTALPRS